MVDHSTSRNYRCMLCFCHETLRVKLTKNPENPTSISRSPYLKMSVFFKRLSNTFRGKSQSTFTNFPFPFGAIVAISGGISYFYYFSEPKLVIYLAFSSNFRFRNVTNAMLLRLLRIVVWSNGMLLFRKSCIVWYEFYS